MSIKTEAKILINEENGKLILEITPSLTEKLSGLTKTIAKKAKQVTKFIDRERKNRTLF